MFFNIFNDGDAFYDVFQSYHNMEKQQFQLKGMIGESFLNGYLNTINLPGYYRVISNVLLPIGKVKTQVDTVLIHEKGIFCIEYKNLAGWIFGSENQKQWTQSMKRAEKYYFHNPVKQNKTHCDALAGVLRTVSSNIESLIVFGERCKLMKINCPNVPVIQLQDLSNYLMAFFCSHENRFTEKNVDAVYELLKLYIPTEEQMKEHIERVRKYTEGLECPKCGSGLKLDKRILKDGRTSYYFRCTHSNCGFERDATYAEVIKYGNDEDRAWAYSKLI